MALLPVYAREILNIGAYGLGVLRSAPSLGAVLMAITVAHFPLRRRAGRIMLMCVFGFGVLTVVFGISRNFVVSLAALVLLGACDMISVIVRQTLVQISTPDEMRGRVSAVSGDLHRGIQRAGWLRIRSNGAVVRHGARRRARRHWHHADRGAVVLAIPRTAAGEPVSSRTAIDPAAEAVETSTHDSVRFSRRTPSRHARSRRVNRRLMPYLVLLYIVAYLDRVNVGYAGLQMTRELGFSNAVFGLGGGMFFLGYFLLEIPGPCWLKSGARANGSRAFCSRGDFSPRRRG